MISRGMLALVSAAVSVVVAVPAAPAQAATGSGSLVAPGTGVLYEGCRDVEIGYSLDLPSGTDSWSMEVTAFGSDGIEDTSDYVFDDADGNPGVAELQFCGGDDADTYTVEAEVEASDFDSDNYGEATFSLSPVTFVMRRPASRTTASVATKGKTKTISATARDERPNGYFVSKDMKFRLQTRTATGWSHVSNSTTYVGNGRHTYRIPRSSKLKVVRVVATYDGSITESVSKPVRLR